VDVPAQDHEEVKNGWPKYYGQPWKKYLAEKSKRRR
jgi:hypothetical protein